MTHNKRTNISDGEKLFSTGEKSESASNSSSHGFNRFMPHKTSGGWISESRVAYQMLGD